MIEKYLRFLSQDNTATWGRVLDDSDPTQVRVMHLFSDSGFLGLNDHAVLLEQLRSLSHGEEVVVQKGRFLPPVARPPNIIAAGLNYVAHGLATGQLKEGEKPPMPVMFPKWTNAVAAHCGVVSLPEADPDTVDYEVELGVIISRLARNVKAGEAHQYIAALTVANDLSARRTQGVYPEMAKNAQWGPGKSFDGFCPLGYYVVGADPADLEIRLSVNGVPKQYARTSDMICPVPQLIEYLSRDTTLLPGTVILTGTPKGTQIEEHFAKREPKFLRSGDIVIAEIQDLGKLVTYIK